MQWHVTYVRLGEILCYVNCDLYTREYISIGRGHIHSAHGSVHKHKHDPRRCKRTCMRIRSGIFLARLAHSHFGLRSEFANEARACFARNNSEAIKILSNVCAVLSMSLPLSVEESSSVCVAARVVRRVAVSPCRRGWIVQRRTLEGARVHMRHHEMRPCVRSYNSFVRLRCVRTRRSLDVFL